MNRHEERRGPERLDDSIAEENPVRFMDACVDELARAQRGLQRLQAAATGRPAYPPGDLWQLDMDGALYRLRSRRRLEQETPRQVALLGLLQTLRPAPKTLAHCRRDHRQPLRQGCRALPLLGKQLNVGSGALVAMDGSTGKAVHAQARHVPQSQLQRLLPQSEARLEASLPALERGDTEEDQGAPGGARAAHLPRPTGRPCSSASAALRPSRGNDATPGRRNAR